MMAITYQLYLFEKFTLIKNMSIGKTVFHKMRLRLSALTRSLRRTAMEFIGPS